MMVANIEGLAGLRKGAGTAVKCFMQGVRKRWGHGFRGDEWSIKIFNCLQNLNECSLACAPQVFALLASSQSKFFISAHARKKIAVRSMLANARKDHSTPLVLAKTVNPNDLIYFCTEIFHLVYCNFQFFKSL